MRLLTATGALLLALAAPVPTAQADSYPPGGVEVVRGTAFAVSGAQGIKVRFTGTGFAPRSPIHVSVNGVNAGTTVGGPDGVFGVSLPAPQLGTSLLSASGLAAGGRVHVVTASIVLAPNSVAAPRRPGLDRVYNDLAAGLAFVLLAVMVVVAGQAIRRRPLS